ncbi:hypothetical protein TW83_19020, partial [Paracoccus sp. S4493]
MTDGSTARDDLALAVAILAPRGRDAAVAAALLDKVGIASVQARDLPALAGLVGATIGVAL